jgi:hypothetical protein
VPPTPPRHGERLSRPAERAGSPGGSAREISGGCGHSHGRRHEPPFFKARCPQAGHC